MMKSVLIAASLTVLAGAGFLYALVDRTQEHGDRMAMESSLTRALNGPDGPDYLESIRIYEQSELPAETKAVNIRADILAACEQKLPPCIENRQAVANAAVRDLNKLARTAQKSIDRAGAARVLAHTFETGLAGAVPTDPAQAKFWNSVSLSAAQR